MKHTIRPWTAWLVPPAYRDAVVGDALEEIMARSGERSWRARLRTERYVVVAALACWAQVIRDRAGLSRNRSARSRGGDMLSGGSALWLQGIRSDARYAWRGLARSPAFSAVAAGTLGLGVAGVTVMFNLLYASMIRPLAYERASETFVLHTTRLADTFPALSKPDLEDVRSRARTLSEVATWQPWSVTVPLADGTPTRTAGASVDSRYFNMLGVAPLLGRLFTPDDDGPGHEPVVVVGHGYWLNVLGGDSTVVGRSLDLDGARYAIVGVMPAGFIDPLAVSFGVATPPLWRASPTEFSTTNRSWRSFRALARGTDASTLGAIEAELSGIARDLRTAWPGTNAEVSFMAVPLREHLVGANRSTILLLSLAVGLLMIVACANIASLLLARGTARLHEQAIRRTLGAGRLRVLRPVIFEHALLAAAGSALGIGAAFGVAALARPWTSELSALVPIHMDGPVLAGAAGISFLLAMVFGSLPSWHIATRDGGRSQGTRVIGGPAERLRRGLVMAQTALAAVILVGTGLLLQGFRRAQAVDLGINVDRVVVADVTPSTTVYGTPEALDQAISDVVTRVASLPGVTAAGIISDLPLTGAANTGWVTRPDMPAPAGAAPPSAHYRTVEGDLFRALGISLVEGRAFDDRDHASSAPVAVINRATADLLFPGEDPLLRQLGIMGQNRVIVGVVSDVRDYGPMLPAPPAVYVPFTQERQEWATRTTSVVASIAAGAPGDFAGALRDAVLAVNRATAVNDARAMADVAALSTRSLRIRAAVMGLFALAALILAAVGLAGVVAFQVARRRRELSLRMALGGTPRAVVGMLVGRAIRMCVAGVAAGFGLVVMLSRWVELVIPDVEVFDPFVYLAVPAVFLGATLLSASIPAARAALVAPAEALKQE